MFHVVWLSLPSFSLHRQTALYEEEKHLRLISVDALRHLWKEVQSLQAWKTQQQQAASTTEPTTEATAAAMGDSAGMNESIARLLGSLQQGAANNNRSELFPPSTVSRFSTSLLV